MGLMTLSAVMLLALLWRGKPIGRMGRGGDDDNFCRQYRLCLQVSPPRHTP
jgi:hypothetical protein